MIQNWFEIDGLRERCNLRGHVPYLEVPQLSHIDIFKDLGLVRCTWGSEKMFTMLGGSSHMSLFLCIKKSFVRGSSTVLLLAYLDRTLTASV